jgi:hypothetical protein
MATPFKIGYHISCEFAGSNRQKVADEQIALHSSVVKLLDDHKADWFFSKQIAARSPETLRVCRTYMNGWDGNLNEAPDGNSPTGYLSPINYVNYLEGLNAPPGTVHQVQCEGNMHRSPQDPTGARLLRNVHWQSEVAIEMSKRGMRGAFDFKQTVTYDEREIDDGLHDELWRTLDKHPEHFLGVDAYWLGDAWLNTTAADMGDLAWNAPIAVDAYLSHDDSHLKAHYIAKPNEAHLGREEIIARHCRKIGIKVPRMIYGEYGADNVRLSQQPDVERINGRVPMGYPTMAQYWRVHYPQWTKARTFFEMCKWSHRSFPDYIVGAALFAKDTSFENGAYHIEDDEFQRLLVDYSASVRAGTPAQPPKPTPPPVVTLPPTIPDLPTETPPEDDDTPTPTDPFMASLTARQRHGRAVWKTEYVAIMDYFVAREKWETREEDEGAQD